MKKIIALIFASCIIISAAACQSTTKNKEESPDTAVMNLITAIKESDTTAINKYLGTTSVLTWDDNGTENYDANVQLIFSKVSCKTVSSTVNGDNAVVNAEITSLDMKSIFGTYVKEALTLSMGNAFKNDSEKLSEEEIKKQTDEILSNLMKDEKAALTTQTIKISCSKSGNSWVIKNDEAFQDALTGGFVSTVESYNSANTTKSEEMSVSENISEINSYIIKDIWNEGFCDIAHYTEDGKDSTGQTMDIDFTLQRLDDAMTKKADYDSFVNNLAGVKYEKLKQYWTKLSDETDKLYKTIKSSKPKAADQNYNFDTGLFTQYRDAFSDEVDKLDE